MTDRLIQHALKFTDDELSSNRTGQLTSTQQRRLLWQRQRGKRTFIILGIGMLGSAVMMAALPDVPLICSGYMLFGLVGVVILSRLLAVGESTSTYEIEQGHLYNVNGYPTRVQRQVTQMDPDTQTQLNKSRYFITVQDVEFRVSPGVFKAFDEDRKYRVYYLPESRKIIAAETAERLIHCGAALPENAPIPVQIQ